MLQELQKMKEFSQSGHVPLRTKALFLTMKILAIYFKETLSGLKVFGVMKGFFSHILMFQTISDISKVRLVEGTEETSTECSKRCQALILTTVTCLLLTDVLSFHLAKQQYLLIKAAIFTRNRCTIDRKNIG